MKIIMKWGEYSNDVQFILQRSDSVKTVQPTKIKSSGGGSSSSTPTHNSSGLDSSDQQKDVNKSFRYIYQLFLVFYLFFLFHPR